MSVPPIPPLLCLLQKRLDGSGILTGECAVELQQRPVERGKRAAQILPVGQRDVAPHFGRTGGNPCRVPESSRAEKLLLGWVFWIQDAIRQRGSDDVGQMA